MDLIMIEITVDVYKKNSQLSPYGHPTITDIPIIRTEAKSQAKIDNRSFTEINSRYDGLLLMRTLTRRPYTVRY